MTCRGLRSTGLRWFKFNVVGGIGIAVQLLMLAVLKTGLGLNYLFATGLAVEVAVVHNFLWHEGFTWKDRRSKSSHDESRLARFVKFSLTTGVFSIAGNLVFMRLLAGVGKLNYLVANGITIAACSVGNFLVSDGFVFAEARQTINPCELGARRTKCLPVFVRRDTHAPSNQRSGA